MFFRYPVYPGKTPQPEYFAEFQDRLTEVGGLNPFGEPNLKLTWGGSELEWYSGQEVMKYSHRKKEVDLAWEVKTSAGPKWLHMDRRKWTPEDLHHYGKSAGRIVRCIVDVGTPRFYIESWMPPGAVCFRWKEEQFETDPQTGELVDVLGEAPSRGYWAGLFCLETEKGDYRGPGEMDLESVRECLWLRERDEEFAKFSWGQPPPAWVISKHIERYWKNSREQEEAEILASEERIYDIVRSKLCRSAMSFSEKHRPATGIQTPHAPAGI